MDSTNTENGVKGGISKYVSSRRVWVTLLVLCLISAPVVAQTVSQTDQFENGNIDGWQGQNIQFVTDSIERNGSLQAADNIDNQGDNAEWVDGPSIDLNDEFTVKGTVKPNQGTDGYRVGLGLVEPAGDNVAEGVLLIFSDEFGSTFIAENNLEDPSIQGLDTINSDFDESWVRFELYSTGNGTIRAKVWQYGSTEPTDYQLTRDMNTQSGSFSLFTGVANQGRTVTLDSVTVEGTRAPSDEELTLDTRSLVEPGDTHPYDVLFTRTDVTDNATVTSLNTSVLTIDSTNQTITGVNDSSIAESVNVTAEYNGFQTTKEIVVAEPTVDNLDILPTFLTRILAILQDPTIFALLIAGLVSVPASRFASSFGGLAAAEMVIVIGWVAGYIGIGIAMLSVFTAIFIGLNLAENTQVVSRGGGLR